MVRLSDKMVLIQDKKLPLCEYSGNLKKFLVLMDEVSHKLPKLLACCVLVVLWSFTIVVIHVGLYPICFPHRCTF